MRGMAVILSYNRKGWREGYSKADYLSFVENCRVNASLEPPIQNVYVQIVAYRKNDLSNRRRPVNSDLLRPPTRLDHLPS